MLLATTTQRKRNDRDVTKMRLFWQSLRCLLLESQSQHFCVFQVFYYGLLVASMLITICIMNQSRGVLQRVSSPQPLLCMFTSFKPDSYKLQVTLNINDSKILDCHHVEAENAIRNQDSSNDGWMQT